MKTYHENNQTLPISTKLNKWPFIIGAIILTAILLYFFRNSYLKIAIIASSFILLFFKEVYGRLRLKEIKKERYTTQKPYAWKINDPKDTEHPDFIALKQYFRQLQESTGKSILFIIERVTPEDHQAQMYESIVLDLKKENRLIERFTHRGEYKWFWTEGYPNEISADDLTEKYGNWIPIFCSDGHRLVDFKLESLSDAVFPFYFWDHRLLLTNRPALSWGYEEELLSVIFTILSFNISGVGAISDLVNQPSGQHHFHQPDEKPELFLKDDEQEVSEKLEAHFGKELTRWVAATALCSKLDWDLTLKIGEYLSKNYNTKYNHTQLRSLSRLGWFRVGEMPEQVRKQLIQYLPIPLQGEIRRLIVEAMEKSPPPHPSHAHNSYRMELVSHKLLIPDFPQKGLKEEFYELKSMGYLEEVGASNYLNHHEDQLNELQKKYFYNDGGALFGWNLKFVIPLLFVLSGTLAMGVDFFLGEPEPPKSPVSEVSYLSVSVQDIFGNNLENVTLNLGIESVVSDKKGSFEIKFPQEGSSETFNLIVKKPYFFHDTMIINSNQKSAAVKLIPNTVDIKVVDNSNQNNNVKNAKVTLSTNNGSKDNIYTDENGEAILTFKNKYKSTYKFKVLIEKIGFKSQEQQFGYDHENKIVYLQEEVDVVDPNEEYTLEGSIESQCGDMVEGVLVEIQGYSSKKISTKKDGRFKINFTSNSSKKTFDVKFSKGNSHLIDTILNTTELKKFQTIKLVRRKIIIKVYNEADEKDRIETEVFINADKGVSTNKWGYYTYILKKDAKCKLTIAIDHKDYNISDKTYDLTEDTIKIALTKKTPPPCKFFGFVKEKCGHHLDEVDITINDQTTRNISTKDGNFDFVCNGDKEKISITISKEEFHPITKTIETKNLNERVNFELSRKKLKFKVVDANNQKITISGANVRFEDGKTRKTKDQGQFNLAVEKTFDCAQILEIENRGYLNYSEPMKIQNGKVLIELNPEPINQTEREFVFQVKVLENKEPVDRVNVIGFTNKLELGFKKKGSGIYGYTVKEKSDPELFKYFNTGGKFKVVPSKIGYFSEQESQYLNKDKPQTTFNLTNYLEVFQIEISDHQGEVEFLYKEKPLPVIKKQKGIYTIKIDKNSTFYKDYIEMTKANSNMKLQVRSLPIGTSRLRTKELNKTIIQKDRKIVFTIR